MLSLTDKNMVVIGGSRGVGRRIVEAGIRNGARVLAVARQEGPLRRLAQEVSGTEVLALDATEEGAPSNVFDVLQPDILVLCWGAFPPAAPLHEQTWQEFAVNWETDVKIAFHFLKAALSRPLPAGAKWTQKLLAVYLQGISDQRKLGIRFVALVPMQTIAGTEIGDKSSKMYAEKAGITHEKFMERFGKPLTPQMVADAILTLSLGEGPVGPAIAITGNSGLEAMG